jgi:hypothetical protein
MHYLKLTLFITFISFWVCFGLFAILRPSRFYMTYRGDFKPNQKMMSIFYRVMGSVAVAVGVGLLSAFLLSSPTIGH